MKTASALFLCSLSLALTSPAAMVFTENPLLVIPDGNSSGLVRFFTVGPTTETIVSVTVELEISAAPSSSAFLGDLYVYLTNGTQTAILLNRPGRSASRPAGYGDNQSLAVTFTETAVNDIHTYRTAITGDENTPLTGTLSGSWLADGRTTDPGSVVTSDPPTARLNVFDGLIAEGDWSLFVADLSTGGEHRLDGWTLTLETIPEPSTALLCALGTAAVLRRRRNA